MTKRMIKSHSHSNVEQTGQMTFDWNVRYVIEKICSKDTTFTLDSS
jgi:hypothetical protein